MIGKKLRRLHCLLRISGSASINVFFCGEFKDAVIPSIGLAARRKRGEADDRRLRMLL